MNSKIKKTVLDKNLLNLADMCDFHKLNLNIEKINYNHDKKTVISLLLPTRKRTKHLDDFINSLLEKTHDIDQIEIVLYVDDDDIATCKYSNEEISITKIIGPRLTMGQYNSVCYRHSSGNIIMLMNDDVIIETKNWDKLLTEQLGKIDDEIYLAYPDDSFNHGKLSTFPVLSRKTCDILFYPYPPLYKRLFIDTHIMDVFYRLISKSTDRIIYLGNIKFTHHSLASHFENEDSYQRTDYHDDNAFISLRQLRISQAARLQSIIDGTELPLLNDKFLLKDEHGNYLSNCRWFYKEFLNDNGLPLLVRIKYFVRYAGHFFMIKTIVGTYVSKTLTIFKKNKISTVAC